MDLTHIYIKKYTVIVRILGRKNVPSFRFSPNCPSFVTSQNCSGGFPGTCQFFGGVGGGWWVRLVGGGIITGPSMYIFFVCWTCLGLHLSAWVREGGRSHRQFWDVNILGRKNVPSLKKPKMSQFCYAPEYLRPKYFTPQYSYDYGIRRNKQKRQKFRAKKIKENL